MTDTINLTPRGATTPEGVKHIHVTMGEFQDAKMALATYFKSLLRGAAGGSGHVGNQARALAKLVNGRDVLIRDSEELAELLQRERDSEVAFMRAVAGI
jgi:hypothetical protein